MSSSPFIFRILNPIMIGILKSPMHSLVSSQIMIFTFNGRRSGNEFSTPVSYYQEDNHVYCFTHADWWVNLIGGKQVGLLIGGQEYTGEAVPIREDKEKMIAGLGKLLTAVPNDMRYYNVSTDAQGNLNQAELECAVDEATMIEITLAGPDA